MDRRMSRFARMAAGEEGIALITVMIIAMIATIFGAAMVANVVSQQSGITNERRITSARAAADAGVDRLIFELSQGTAWEDMANTYSTSAAWWGDSSNGGWWSIGKGGYRAHIDAVSDPSLRVLTLEGKYPMPSGSVRRLQATVKRTGQVAPEALGYALFGDKKIDIHHHGSSFISPTVATTDVHSNGEIKIDFTSSFYVDQMEAVTNIDIGSGGSNPGGTSGYNWAYWIPGSDTNNSPRCYPAKVFPAGTISSSNPSFSTYWAAPSGTSCAGAPLYSPNAQIKGDIYANNVKIASKGDTVQSISGTTCFATGQPGWNDPVTGSCIPDRFGDIHAHTINLPGKTITGPGNGQPVQIHYRSGVTPPPCSGPTCYADCAMCNQGTADTGGHVGGVVYAHDTGWTVPTIPFPSLDYEDIYLPLAQADQNGATGCGSTVKTCHVFPTSDGKDLFTYISNSAIVTSGYSTSTCKTCVFWLDANKNDTTTKANVRYVVAKGTFYLNQDFNVSESTMRSKFSTPSSAPAPELMVAGSVIVPEKGVDLNGSLTVVGKTMDPFQPRAVYSPDTIPGILASGSGMGANDVDADSGWTSAGQYEPLKRNRTIIRGLAYTGAWSDALGASISQDLHFHSYDPKNQLTIIGALVGGGLHLCNSFEFGYDPLVQNLPFSEVEEAGGIIVTDWQEI